VKAKPQHHKFLIGRQGIHIQKIRNETGARIIFPGADDTDRESITIIGRYLGSCVADRDVYPGSRILIFSRVPDPDFPVPDPGSKINNKEGKIFWLSFLFVAISFTKLENFYFLNRL
jgi:hypothetical protein